MPAVAFENVDIVFGTNLDAAFALLDRGASRDEVIAATDCVPGAVDINFAVERGEICVLMGLSGSGKSTVLRAINRLNTVARGTVTVEHEGKTIDVGTCDDSDAPRAPHPRRGHGVPAVRAPALADGPRECRLRP